MPQPFRHGLKLTEAQRRVFEALEKTGRYTATTGFSRRAGDALVEKGIAVCVSRRKYEWKYELIPVNKRVNAPSPAKPSAIPKEKSYLKGVLPDPIKPKIKRPPAVYSNATTGAALIDKILNTRNGK